MRHVLQVAVAVIALLVMGALARVPYQVNADGSALLRLSWRTRGEASEHCRDRTAEELAALPAHMRTPQVCTGKVADYRLELTVDGQRFTPIQLHAAGAHADRPIYVFKELELTPGGHSVDVAFYSTLHENHRLRLRESLQLQSGDIVLLTTDPVTGQLVVRRAGTD